VLHVTYPLVSHTQADACWSTYVPASIDSHEEHSSLTKSPIVNEIVAGGVLLQQPHEITTGGSQQHHGYQILARPKHNGSESSHSQIMSYM
jgi:hypothetical protein